MLDVILWIIGVLTICGIFAMLDKSSKH